MTEYAPCKHCGNAHRMGIENMETGEIEPIDICHTCLYGSYIIPSSDIILDDFPDDALDILAQNMKDTYNKLIDNEQ